MWFISRYELQGRFPSLTHSLGFSRPVHRVLETPAVPGPSSSPRYMLRAGPTLLFARSFDHPIHLSVHSVRPSTTAQRVCDAFARSLVRPTVCSFTRRVPVSTRPSSTHLFVNSVRTLRAVHQPESTSVRVFSLSPARSSMYPFLQLILRTLNRSCVCSLVRAPSPIIHWLGVSVHPL